MGRYKNIDITKFKNILICFPHPDDEVFLCGGLIRKFAALNAHTTLITCTMGERGTPDASQYEALREIRAKELDESTRILHISTTEHCDHGDGQLMQKKQILAKELKQKLTSLQPDLVITYDTSGFYGHPDHIALSEVITDMLTEKQFHKISLWYVTLPKKLFRYMALPTHMAQDKEFNKKRTEPTGRIWIGRYIGDKINAIYTHKSQLASFKKAIPQWMPLWYWHSLFMWEYVHEVKKG